MEANTNKNQRQKTIQNYTLHQRISVTNIPDSRIIRHLDTRQAKITGREVQSTLQSGILLSHPSIPPIQFHSIPIIASFCTSRWKIYIYICYK